MEKLEKINGKWQNVYLREELIELVKNHDYAYEYSDNHSTFISGNNSARKIRSVLEELVNQGEDVNILLEDCLRERPEQFNDGLTHSTIRLMFSKYQK